MAYLPIKWGQFALDQLEDAEMIGGMPAPGFQRRRRQTRAIGGLGGFGFRSTANAPESPYIKPQRIPRRPPVAGTDRIMDIHAALRAEPEVTYQDQVFSANQEQHRALVQLLRERGHIAEDEQVPEDVKLRRLDDF